MAKEIAHHSSRALFSLCALLLAAGDYGHTAAFGKAATAIEQSNLPAFYGAGLKVLWLLDSATMAIIVAIFAWLAIRPGAATRPITLLIAVIPIVNALLIYYFVGAPFYAHLSLAIGILAVVASLLSRPVHSG